MKLVHTTIIIHNFIIICSWHIIFLCCMSFIYFCCALALVLFRPVWGARDFHQKNLSRHEISFAFFCVCCFCVFSFPAFNIHQLWILTAVIISLSHVEGGRHACRTMNGRGSLTNWVNARQCCFCYDKWCPTSTAQGSSSSTLILSSYQSQNINQDYFPKNLTVTKLSEVSWQT